MRQNSGNNRADSSGRRNTIRFSCSAIGGWMGTKGFRWLRPDERELIAARLAEGASLQGLAAQFGCSQATIARVRDEALMLRRRAGHSRLRLSFEERERIFVGIQQGGVR
jgi:hypothetical protein